VSNCLGRQIFSQVKFKPAANFKQLYQLQTSCKSSFHIAAANLKKLHIHAIIFIQKMRKALKELRKAACVSAASKMRQAGGSKIFELENLKNSQISAIIYIQGERKVTHQEIKNLLGCPLPSVGRRRLQ
jgi:hypothetical protein